MTPPHDFTGMTRPKYSPFDDRPFRHRIGMRPLDLATWIEPDADFDEQLTLKARLLTERHSEVFAALPGTEAAAAEVLELIQIHMRTYEPGRVRSPHSELHPLDAAGRLVQEDLCLMIDLGTEDGLVLGAASLCFPGRWRLAEKIGKPMMAIHEPVARYAEHVGQATDEFFARLAVDKPIWRLNWSVVDDAMLFQPTGHGESVHANIAPDQWFLRVERQTLRRLPTTGAILFTIKTYVTPIAEIADLEERTRLAAALRNMPEDMRTYKSLSRHADAIADWLRTQPHSDESGS
jgi:dimethylamine monooxygenase subunit A